MVLKWGSGLGFGRVVMDAVDGRVGRGVYERVGCVFVKKTVEEG